MLYKFKNQISESYHLGLYPIRDFHNHDTTKQNHNSKQNHYSSTS